MRKDLLFLVILSVLFLPFYSFSADYTQSCNSSGTCECKPDGTHCATDFQCLKSNLCSYSCPSALPNSSTTGNNCDPDWTGCLCYLPTEECGTGVKGICNCLITGNCEYSCDEGYEWLEGECSQIPIEFSDLYELVINENYPDRQFYIQKTLTYGEAIIIWFFTIFAIFTIFKTVFNFLWRK